MFDESQHPRDDGGKFTDKGGGSRENYTQSVNDRIKWAKENGVDLPFNTDGSIDDLKLQELYEKGKKETSTKKVVKVDMDAEIQKQLNAAETPKERQNIAFHYIMDNLRGKYAAPDGRTVAIERVGADKMTYQDNKIKLRVCPSLADMIKSGEFQYMAKSDEKKNQKFKEFAYYKVTLQVGDEQYTGLLNVGIRENGSSTLYDLKPLYKK